MDTKRRPAITLCWFQIESRNETEVRRSGKSMRLLRLLNSVGQYTAIPPWFEDFFASFSRALLFGS